MSSDRDARKFFDAIARRYDRDYALSGAASRERLARVLATIAGKKRVLVLGIGTGRELPALLDAGHDVEAIEISPAMIAACNQRSRRVPIREGDFYDPLPFPDARFDAVLALHGTLAHPPRDGALKELGTEVARVLASTGLLVAEVPAAQGLQTVTDTRLTVTGPTSFIHHDDRASVSIDGIALDAEGWRGAFAPALAAKVTSLEEPVLEYLVVARRARSSGTSA